MLCKYMWYGCPYPFLQMWGKPFQHQWRDSQTSKTSVTVLPLGSEQTWPATIEGI